MEYGFKVGDTVLVRFSDTQPSPCEIEGVVVKKPDIAIRSNTWHVLTKNTNLENGNLFCFKDYMYIKLLKKKSKYSDR